MKKIVSFPVLCHGQSRDDFQKKELALSEASQSIPQRDLAISPSDKAIIYKSELDFVSRCILDYPHIETGGQMFGYWTDDGTPVVLYTIGPGPCANHQITFFNQDLSYLESVGNVLVRKYGLQHIGEWHSHHRLGLAHPSGHDASSMAKGLVESKRNRFLLCIGNITADTTKLNPFNFVNGKGTDYEEAHWMVKPADSPFRELIDTELRNMLCQPNTPQPNYSGMDSCNSFQPEANATPQYDSEYWLSDKNNNKVLKAIMDFLNSDLYVFNLKPMLDNQKHVHLTCTYNRELSMTVSFPLGFPNVPPVFKICKTDWNNIETPCELILPEWRFDGDIYNSFVEYYKNIEL